MDIEKNDDLDIENQDVENSVDNDNNDTLNDSDSSDDKDYKTLYENQKRRAEIAEAKAKGASGTKASEKAVTGQPTASDSPLSREEAILYAKGFSDEEIAQMKKVAAVNETDVLSASNDELFTDWKAKRDKEERLRKATPQPNSRSGKVEVRKNVNDTGLSRDEHKRLAMEKMQSK